MMKHIMKYKGDVNYKNIKDKKVVEILTKQTVVDIELTDLEKRFQKLIKDDFDYNEEHDKDKNDNGDDTESDDNDNCQAMTIRRKKLKLAA